MSVTRTITVAAGAFAPGHLGELIRIVPFELADAVLEETPGARERRVRLLPSRAGPYFLLAMCLFLQDHVPRVPDGLLRRLQVHQGARYGGSRGRLAKQNASNGETGYPALCG